MDWNEFVARVTKELCTDSGYINFRVPFAKEQDLTREIAHGLRRLFSECFPDATDLHDRVVCRKGDEPEDRRAWKGSQRYKWVNVHGLNFVPDVLLRGSLNDFSRVLPIEIKLVARASCSGEFARGIGQSLIYSVRYSPVILFVGVKAGVTASTFDVRTDEEKKLRGTLWSNGVTVIFRDVG